MVRITQPYLKAVIIVLSIYQGPMWGHQLIKSEMKWKMDVFIKRGWVREGDMPLPVQSAEAIESLDQGDVWLLCHH